VTPELNLAWRNLSSTQAITSIHGTVAKETRKVGFRAGGSTTNAGLLGRGANRRRTRRGAVAETWRPVKHHRATPHCGFHLKVKWSQVENCLTIG
jgi:hypothetical protein